MAKTSSASPQLHIDPPAGCKVYTEVSLPGSKSIANRLLLIRAMAGASEPVRNLPDSGDTLLMQQLLERIRQCGKDEAGRETVSLDCGNAGTVLRFLTSYLANLPGSWLLTGDKRMKQRPVGALVEALLQIGADIRYTGQANFPPLLINGRQLKGGKTGVSSAESSQFASSLLMAAPMMPEGLEITFTGSISSRPYLDMTLQLMRQNGIAVSEKGKMISVPGKPYVYKPLEVEADWSAASYWFEVAALSAEAGILLRGLKQESLQGDAAAAGYFSCLGVGIEKHPEGLLLKKDRQVKQGQHFMLKHHPDLAPALAATMAGLEVQGSLDQIQNLAIKESDRAEVLYRSLASLGYGLLRYPDRMVFTGKKQTVMEKPVLQSANDHRILMSLAPLCLKEGSLLFDSGVAVAKSYPSYWDDLRQAGFRVEEKKPD
ncbi:MAG TPA: 3-phosphoshikimate 1-carboxyvinyltransferase [Bacteroidales bacterium]|nr:3-phosphoshikimate 1-carboxyvinyltransferase [Bacteroidales bacterium]HSA43633.1 3-phosphoshikimate 1-carboxyvinyltransferase [Bacteroidales bacterium]